VGRQIYDCANSGHVAQLTALLDEWNGNPIVNWELPEEKGKTALYVACKRGHTACVAALLKQPCIYIHKGPKGMLYGIKTPFSVAANDEIKALFTRMFPKINVTAPSSVGEQMWKLAKDGNADALKPLLDEWRGNPIIHWKNPKDENRFPLLKACSGGHTDTVKLLLEQPSIGESINAINNFGVAPLLTACAFGHTAVVKLLLSLPLATIGDSINKPNNDDGDTPLHHACLWGHKEIAALLRAKGATK
jgi:ankyrin repeat protein